MTQLTDIELVELARADNEEAKEELFERCKAVISYSIGRYKANFYKGLDKVDIEDLSSECSIAVMEGIRLYKPERGASFPHFLKFIIRTRLYKWVENRIEDSNNLAHVSDLTLNRIPAPYNITEIMRDLTIKVKNERDKKIIEMFLEGMRQTEIADEFKISKMRVGQIIRECIK